MFTRGSLGFGGPRRSCLLHVAALLLIVMALGAWVFNSGWLWDYPGVSHSYTKSYAEGHYRNGAWTRAKADDVIFRDYWGRQAIRSGTIVGSVGLVAVVYLTVRKDLLYEWL